LTSISEPANLLSSAFVRLIPFPETNSARPYRSFAGSGSVESSAGPYFIWQNPVSGCMDTLFSPGNIDMDDEFLYDIICVGKCHCFSKTHAIEILPEDGSS